MQNTKLTKLRIAFTMQNVGIDLSKDVGPASLIKRIIEGLGNLGHSVSILRLVGSSVYCLDDIQNLNNGRRVSLRLSGTRGFRLLESGIRRLQTEFKIPYFALFDSFRFYEACVHNVENYSLVHEYGSLFSFGTALACWRKKIPYILTVEADLFLERSITSAPYTGFHANYASIFARFTYKLANKIITVSNQAKQQLINSWEIEPEKIVVMPNGVDIELFGQRFNSQIMRAKYGLDSNPLIGFVGSFQKWHGIDILLNSLVQVLSQVPDARLLLVGDGPARPDVEKWIADLQLESKVTITGYVPQNKVPELLAAIDVAILPYPRFAKELWFSPLKMYEYMAAGKAIVASKYGQIADVLQDGQTGILVEPGNVEELTQALIRVLEDDHLRSQLGSNAFIQARTHHSWEQYVAHLEDIYLSIL